MSNHGMLPDDFRQLPTRRPTTPPAHLDPGRPFTLNDPHDPPQYVPPPPTQAELDNLEAVRLHRQWQREMDAMAAIKARPLPGPVYTHVTRSTLIDAIRWLDAPANPYRIVNLLRSTADIIEAHADLWNQPRIGMGRHHPAIARLRRARQALEAAA